MCVLARVFFWKRFHLVSILEPPGSSAGRQIEARDREQGEGVPLETEAGIGRARRGRGVGDFEVGEFGGWWPE